MISPILEKIIFQPVQLPRDHRYDFEQPFEEYFLQPEDGVLINALHFKAEQSRGVILYFHGNKDNLERWGRIVAPLTRLNYDVFAMDYRGYGKSTGDRSEEALYRDAQYVHQFVTGQLKPEQLILFGRSLGTGIASWLAGQTRVHKLILETPYYDMADLVFRFIPWKKSGYKLEYSFKSHTYLRKSEFPILILHGTSDRVVPFSSGKKLFESTGNPQASLVSIEGGSHNDLYKYEVYWKQLNQFINGNATP